MNYYPFHIGDYASHTKGLSLMEDLAYRRLLDLYYTNESPLCDDAEEVAREIGMRDQLEAVAYVLKKYFPNGENARADAEIKAMLEKQQKQRDRANKRWNSAKESSGTAEHIKLVMPRHDETYATAQESDAGALPPTPTPTPIIKTPHTNAQAPDGSIGWVENWEPDKKHLADQLGFRGVAMPSDAGLEQILYAFRAHYETKPMTDKQSMAKLVAWIQREHKPTNPDKSAGKTNRHAGFEDTDYSAGVLPDGRF